MTAEPGVRVEELDSLFYRCTLEGIPPLSTRGSEMYGGRFNPSGLPTLYLASTPQLALAESTHAMSLASIPPFAPRTLVCTAVRLSRVIDLTEAQSIEALGLTVDGLTRLWQGHNVATQLVGAAMADEHVEGILFPSRIDPSLSNLAVFTANLLAGSHLEVVNKDGVEPD